MKNKKAKKAKNKTVKQKKYEKIIEGIIYLAENNSLLDRGFDGYWYRIELIFNNKKIDIKMYENLKEIEVQFSGQFNWEHYEFYPHSSPNFKKLVSIIRKKCELKKINLGEEFIDDIKLFKRQNTLDKLI